MALISGNGRTPDYLRNFRFTEPEPRTPVRDIPWVLLGSVLR